MMSDYDKEQEQKETTTNTKTYSSHHSFTEDELNMMLFEWDENVDPVKEYHYMKPEWKQQQQQQPIINPGTSHDTKLEQNKKNQPQYPPPPPQDKPNLRGEALDTGYRSVVDLNRNAPLDEDPIPLASSFLNTNSGIHVVEFYQPWCGHCRANKPHYVDVARETKRRSIAIPVYFHAVSCQLYREICRYYDISGFPFIYGWGIGMSIEEKGIELNPAGVIVTADLIANSLGLTLASEPKDVKQRNVTLAERKIEADKMVAAAIATKQKRVEYSAASTLNDRYHNAALSLVFVLRTGVFTKSGNVIDDVSAVALKEFLQLIHWTTPQSWSIRTDLVDELLLKYDSITKTTEHNDGGNDDTDGGGPRLLFEIIERHQTENHDEEGTTKSWGSVERVGRHGRLPTDHTHALGVDVPHSTTSLKMKSSGSGGSSSGDQSRRTNNRWTPECTHDERGMGYTCGLWDLLHIITIGSSMSSHRMFAFRLGYANQPKQIAEILKRFIAHFFACDVCRWNFLDMYDQCGYDHCHRLVDSMPELSGADSRTQIMEQSRALAMWLWEVHNGVSVRLMKEAAAREDRQVSMEEQLAAVFPTRTLCPSCWLNTEMTQYDPDEVFDFLQSWYWPKYEQSDNRFKAIMKRHLSHHPVVARTKEHLETWWFIIGPIALLIGFYLRSRLERKANISRKNN